MRAHLPTFTLLLGRGVEGLPPLIARLQVGPGHPGLHPAVEVPVGKRSGTLARTHTQAFSPQSTLASSSAGPTWPPDTPLCSSRCGLRPGAHSCTECHSQCLSHRPTLSVAPDVQLRFPPNFSAPSLLFQPLETGCALVQALSPAAWTTPHLRSLPPDLLLGGQPVPLPVGSVG